MSRRMVTAPNGKKIVLNSETDTELYQTDINTPPYSQRVTEFRVMIHETSHNKYIYMCICDCFDDWYTTGVMDVEKITWYIQSALHDVDICEKAWPTEEEIEKCAAYGIDIFAEVEN